MRIYEINTWPYLSELSERLGREVTLATVPDVEWDSLAALRFDAVWLMGVWRRSPAGLDIARRTDGVVRDCAAALPGFNVARDIVGSSFCIPAFAVDDHLGGREGLAAAREKLRARGLKLILDFVPNHTAPDHSWLATSPDAYVRGTEEDASQQPRRFFRREGAVFAYGAPSANPDDVWSDTAQMNAFSPSCRDLAVSTLLDIGDQCDGVRCDMAYLLRSDTVGANWGSKAGPRREPEYWTEVIGKVKARHPGMVFVAESYADSEWALLEQCFDYCYDKEKFYDRLRAADAPGLRAHLAGAAPSFLERLVHFCENHDEPPVSEAFGSPERHRQAAVAVATLPGASLWHHLQLEGRWGKQQVQLGTSVSVRSFYQRLLLATHRPALREGGWSMFPISDAPSMLAYGWEHGEDRVIVVLNLSDDEQRWGRVTVPWPALQGASWVLRDLLSGDSHTHSGDDMVGEGMFVRPRRWGADLFEVTRA